MKKMNLLLAAVAVCAASSASAQTFSVVNEIAVDGLEVTPTAVTVIGSDAYVAGFTQRRLLKIEDITDPAATPLQLADLAALASNFPFEASGRGFTDIKVTAAGDLLIAGDAGTAAPATGDGVILVVDTDGNLIRQQAQQVNAANRRVAAAAELPNGRIIATQVGSGIFTFNPELDALAGTAFTATGASFARDIILDGNTIYISATAAGNDRILIGTGGDLLTSNNLTDYVFAEFYDYGFGSFNAARGLSLITVGGVEFIATTTGAQGELRLIRKSDGVLVHTITDGVDEAYDVAVAEIAGTQYLVVAQVNIGGGGGRITVIEVNDGETQAENWEVYN